MLICTHSVHKPSDSFTANQEILVDSNCLTHQGGFPFGLYHYYNWYSPICQSPKRQKKGEAS